MPIFIYKCEACQTPEVEIIQRLSDPAPTCDTCKGELKKKISSSNFQLKGTGWYSSDYKGVVHRKGDS